MFTKIDSILVTQEFADLVTNSIIKLKVKCDHPHWIESRDYMHNNFLSITFGCPDCGLVFKHDFLDTYLAK